MGTNEEPVVLYRKPDRNAGENEDDYVEEERQIPPDGGWGWIIVISGFFAHVLSDGVMYAFGVILDELMTVFKVSAFEVTFVGSLLPAVILGIGPLASTLIVLFGARAITIAGAVIAGLSLIASAFAPTLLFLSISVGVFCGIGFGIIYLPAIVMVSYYFEKRRSLAMGLTVCGSGFGTVALPPLLRLFIHEYGWRGTFGIVGAIVLNCIACGLVLLPLKPTKVWVKKPSAENGQNLAILAIITRDSVDKDGSIEPNGKTANGNGKAAVDAPDISVEVATEADEAKEVIVPLLNSQSKGENVLILPENDEVKYRRGNSHSPQRSAEQLGRPRRHSEAHGPDSPHTIGATSPRTTSRSKQISIHHSQLMPEQRRNPDLIMRPDLLYPSSLTHIPLYQSNRDLFVRQVSHYVAEDDIDGGEETLDVDIKPNLCSQMANSLKNSFDFTLFKDIPFLLFCMSSFMTSLGYNAPYLYIVVWAHKELKFDENQAALLSSYIGVGNIIGRLVFGYIADHPKVSRMLLYILCLVFCGAATIIAPMYDAYWWMVAYAITFGILIGAYVGLTPLLLVDLLGLHRLEVAFGMLGLVQCIATLAGPPVLAQLRDMSGSFTLLFYTCGAAITLSGFMLIPVYLFYTKMRSKVTMEERQLGRADTLVGGSVTNSHDEESSEDTQQSPEAKKLPIA